MKKLLTTILAAAALASTVQAKDIFFIIDAKGFNSNLVPGKITPGNRFEHANFLKKQNKEKQLLYIFAPLKGDNQWRTCEFSFKAEKDGAATFSIYVHQGKAVICDNITVTGTTLVNGNFEKGGEGWKLIDFKRNDGPPEILEDEGVKNSKAVKIFSDKQTVRQTIKLKAGQEVKVKFTYKETDI